MTLAPVRPITLDDIRAARPRIADTIVRTPLVRLELGPGYPEIHLKLENLQPINAYKLRGAANAVAQLSAEDRARGVCTISAGNAGQGVAYAARKAGVPCTVVAIETAPVSKLERMRALGARLVLVSYSGAWKALEDRAHPGVDGVFIHPFDDDAFIASVRSALSQGLEAAQQDEQTQDIRGRLDSLSARERQVLDGLVAGQANKVIAYDLGISPRTVEVYRANVMTKMEARSLSELVRMSMLTRRD